MIPAPPDDRPDMLVDLTRWNRAALGRFRYVDGDAATWLEELRIALLGLYAPGLDPERRTPEAWRHLFSSGLFEPRADPVAEAARLAELAARRAEAEATVAWDRLLADFPEKAETPRRRNARLLAQYDQPPTGDHGWEIMRAFARAAHVLLDHVDAYANEGYLRTATQWEEVRRLAAMVNYQPAPPASAHTLVALTIDPAMGPATVERGLAMQYAPPTGGPPLIFETLADIDAHPDLNAARAEDSGGVAWNRNPTVLPLSGAVTWVAPPRAALAAGDLAVILAGKAPPADPPFEKAAAVSLAAVSLATGADGATATIRLTPAPGNGYIAADTVLHAEPAQVLRGQPRTTPGILAVMIEQIARFAEGGLVQFARDGGFGYGRVLSAGDGVVRVATESTLAGGEVDIAPMTPVGLRNTGGGAFVESRESAVAVFDGTSGIAESFPAFTAIAPDSATPSGFVLEGSEFIAYRMPASAGAQMGYLRNFDYAKAEILREAPAVIIGRPPAPDKTVRFLGKPPKGLAAGDWFAARSGATLTALRVEGVRTEPDGFFIEFHAAVASPEATEFHGPMRQALRPVGHDVNPRPFMTAGKAVLAGLTDAASGMIRPRRSIIVETGAALHARAEVTGIEPLGGGRVRLTLTSATDMTGWAAGRTRFLINTVTAGHGETKGARTLGSGDAEKRRQSFPFKVPDVSFTASSAAEAGVAPDIDVTVNGIAWPYRDMTDPTAEDAQAWSSVLTEAGGMEIHFRQRLVSGTNNVRVARHRVGVGLAGTGVPPLSFAKPMRKHRFVTGIVQPFATEGGADREPASAMRQTAPARLSANGRAVSLADFESLCRRHASVWDARAVQVIGAGAAPRVRLIVVPAGGGAIAGIEAALRAYLKDRALPGVEIVFEGYQDFPVAVAATIQVDAAAHDATAVQAAAMAALTAGFALQARRIGQPFYIAEIMAALERVDGVASTTVQAFGPAPGAPPTGGPGQARLAAIGGAVAAIRPAGHQVARLASLAITPEAI